MNFRATNTQFDESGNPKSSYTLEITLVGDNIFEHSLTQNDITPPLTIYQKKFVQGSPKDAKFEPTYLNYYIDNVVADGSRYIMHEMLNFSPGLVEGELIFNTTDLSDRSLFYAT